MSIYAISDLHLSFNTDKPMNIFGWNEYEKLIEQDWLEKVEDSDLVLLPGDFSWEMNLNDTYKDFEFINKLPGKKLLLKGNHDYWWNTLTKMREFLKKSELTNIDFIFNNAYEFENKIIVGTRGWALFDTEENDSKIRKREALRLEASIMSGIKQFGNDKEIIACMHYPPITKTNRSSVFTELFEKYGVKKCIYGHLHGKSQEEAVEGNIHGVQYIMASCDYTKFKLIKIY